jgi:integrase
MDFRSHMLRDTFAVEMLLAGVLLEKVSKLLTHESVTMTERYYAKWTAPRRQQLEDEAVAAMRRMGVTVSV